MRDKSVISFSLRRYTATKTAKLIVLGLVMAPLIEAERWVSGHDIKQHQVAIFYRAASGYRWYRPPRFYGCLPVQEHIHFRQRPRGTDRFLTEQCIVTTIMPETILRPHFINNEPEPQAGSQMVSPGCGSSSSAIRSETSGGYRIPRLSAHRWQQSFDQIYS